MKQSFLQLALLNRNALVKPGEEKKSRHLENKATFCLVMTQQVGEDQCQLAQVMASLRI